MASRQIRINSSSTIREKLPDISGKYANIVMQSGKVYFVKIESSDSVKIEVADMRLTRIELKIAEVAEIILDVPA